MPNLTGASTTPQPYRNPDTTEQIARNQQESEKWDDLMGVIYVDQEFNDSTVFNTVGSWVAIRQVTVPVPTPCRLEYDAYFSGFSNGIKGQVGIGVFVYNLKGGQPGTLVPNQAQALTAVDWSADGISPFINGYVNLACCGTVDEIAGVYVFQLQMILTTGTTGGIQKGNNCIKVRRGRKPPT